MQQPHTEQGCSPLGLHISSLPGAAAQAGLVATLRARTSVIAAMNPPGRYDASRPLDVNTGLSSPLLSRFDIVLLVLDGMQGDRCGTNPVHARDWLECGGPWL
jgi:MCM P-loop domain